MADNTILPATGSGTADIVVATDKIGGVDFQRVKLSVGDDGSAADAKSGGGMEAGSLRVTIASDSTGVVSVDDNGGVLTVDGTVAISTNAELGIVTETVPATDTASSGLNGRLQRIAQRLTSLIALVPASLGQTTKAGSLAVTLASDQDALPVTDNGGVLTVDGTVELGATTLAALENVSVTVTTAGTTEITNDAGNPIPVSGTVAATQSGTWTVQPGNTANTTAWKVDGSAVTQPVSAASLPLPTGAGTAANQATIITHLDGVEGLLGTIDADTGTLAGAVSGTEMQVDVLTMPTVTVTGSGTFTTSDTASLVDDAAFTPGTGRVLMVGAEFDDTSPDTVNEGDGGAVRMSANRNLYSTIRDAAGSERGANVTAGNALTVDGSASTQPVSGTVTANAGTNLNTSALATEAGNLAAAAASLATLDNIVAGSEAQVDVITSALPTGAATAANQTTAIGHLDGVEGLLTTIDADTSTLAGAVSGSEMQVDVVTSALPTGASTLAEQQTQTTALQLIDDIVQAEDAVHSSGHKGVMALGVRNDAGTALAADGDYIPLSVDSSGAVRVAGGGGGTQYTEADTDASITGNAILWEDGSDTLRAVSAAKPLPVEIIAGGAGGTQYTEDAAGAANPVGTALTLIREDARAGSLTTTDGDNVAARGTNAGELYVKHVDAIPVTDNGGVLTVDGTVAVTHTALTELAAAIDTEVQVDIVSSALPAGAATSAKQDTLIGHVDGIEALLTTIDGDTSNLSVVGGGTEAAAIRVTLANDSTGLVSVDDGGGILTVDGTVAATQSGTWNVATVTTVTAVTAISNALPAGTNAIGKLAANSGVDIGDVDILSSALPTGAATSAAQATIVGHLDGVEGVLTTIDADTGGILTAVELLDDAVAVLGTTTYTEATTKGLTVGAVRRDADTTLVGTTNEIGPLQMDANGRLKVEAFSGEALPVTLTSTTVTGTVAVTQSGTWDEVGINDSGNSITVDNATISVVGTGTEATAQRVTIATDSTGVLSVDDNGGSLTVDGTVAVSGTVTVAAHAVTNAGTFAVQVSSLPALVAGTANIGDVDVATIAAGDNNIGNVDIVTLPALVAGTANIGDVDVLSLPALPAGTNNIGDVDVLTLPNVTLAAGTNTNEVVGDIAHDTGVSGNPVQVAGAAQNMDDTAPPNRVSAESDTTRLAVDWDGTQFVHPHGPQIWSYHLNTSTAQTDTSVHAAPGAGLSLYVTDIVFSSGAATAINMFLEETATTVLGPFYLEATAGRGMGVHLQTPKKITANTALTLTTSASIAHSVDITGFVAQG